MNLMKAGEQPLFERIGHIAYMRRAADGRTTPTNGPPSPSHWTLERTPQAHLRCNSPHADLVVGEASEQGLAIR